MGQSTTQRLESAYARASMNETAKHLQTQQDWQRVQGIQAQSAQAKLHEQQSFRQEYPARLADAREAILNERAAWHYTHPAPQSAVGRDRFNKDQIERQAHLRVHNAHHQTMAKIDKQESQEVRQLMQQRQPIPAPSPEIQRQIKRER